MRLPCGSAQPVHTQLESAGTDRNVRVRAAPAVQWEIAAGELELGVVVGEGAFGKVHRGKWRGGEVAVKRLHSGVVRPEVLDEFRVRVVHNNPI